MSEKIYDLSKRLLLFSRNILVLCKNFPKSSECIDIKRQLIRSATSIGANFEEADGAFSRRDFINKVCISRKEAKETRYWLLLVSGNFVNEALVVHYIAESEELIKILSAIIRNANPNKKFREL